MPREFLEALRTVAGQTSLNMPRELLEALRTVAGQTIQWLKEKDNKYLKTLH
jgi:hypothetical protein